MLGTAGCLYHFRDVIMSGAPEAFFVMFSDVFCDFPLQDMIEFREKYMQYVIMSAEVRYTRSVSNG